MKRYLLAAITTLLLLLLLLTACGTAVERSISFNKEMRVNALAKPTSVPPMFVAIEEEKPARVEESKVEVVEVKEIKPEMKISSETTEEQSEEKKVAAVKEEAQKKEVKTTPPPKSEVGIPVTASLLPDANSKERTTPISHVVIHFTSNVLANPQDPYRANDIRKIFVDYGVSAHYLIGRQGEIHQLVPEERVAFHTGKGSLANFPQYKDQLNDYSIGIELMGIGTKEEMLPMMSGEQYDRIDKNLVGYTESQYASLKRLLNDILTRNPSIKNNRQHIIGHDEYAPGRKTDPGSLFNWSLIGF